MASNTAPEGSAAPGPDSPPPGLIMETEKPSLSAGTIPKKVMRWATLNRSDFGLALPECINGIDECVRECVRQVSQDDVSQEAKGPRPLANICLQVPLIMAVRLLRRGDNGAQACITSELNTRRIAERLATSALEKPAPPPATGSSDLVGDRMVLCVLHLLEDAASVSEPSDSLASKIAAHINRETLESMRHLEWDPNSRPRLRHAASEASDIQ